jgi:hypothetical protein
VKTQLATPNFFFNRVAQAGRELMIPLPESSGRWEVRPPQGLTVGACEQEAALG